MHTKDELTRISEEKEQKNTPPNKAAPLTELPHTPLQSPVSPPLQLASPPANHRLSSKPGQNQSDEHMEEEPAIDRSMDKQQHHELVPDRGLSHVQNELLRVVTSGQQLCKSFTDTQAFDTSAAHRDQHYIQPQIQTSSSALEQIGCSVTVSPSITSHHTEKGSAFPTTPISTAQHDSGFDPSSEATNSPFNFEMHSNIIQQLTKSPGDGFLFQSRPMFDSSVDRDNEQANAANADFLFNIQETRNFPGPTGSGSGQTLNLFGSPVESTCTGGTGFVGTSLSPLNGCSIFGEASPNQSNQQQTTTESAEFSFSFGAKSPATSCDDTSNRSAVFSLF